MDRQGRGVMRSGGSDFPGNAGSGIEAGADGARHQSWYKPVTTVVYDANGEKWISKTYPSFFFPLRQYFRTLARHEYRMLKRAEALTFTPDQVHHGGRCADSIRYRYVEGTALKAVARSGSVPADFFEKLYAAVRQLHRSGLVHLDLGNAGNVLCTASGDPAIIDFGSAMGLYLLPGPVGDWARRKDLLGVLKLWYRFDRDTMPKAAQNYYRAHYRKNIYTPKRLLKALKKRSAQTERAYQGADPLVPVIGLFFGLLALSSLVF